MRKANDADHAYALAQKLYPNAHTIDVMEADHGFTVYVYATEKAFATEYVDERGSLAIATLEFELA